jgi:hypothetical protein
MDARTDKEIQLDAKADAMNLQAQKADLDDSERNLNLAQDYYHQCADNYLTSLGWTCDHKYISYSKGINIYKCISEALEIESKGIK